MKKLLRCFLFIYGACTLAAQAAVTASVENSTVGLNEPVVLNIQSDEDTSAQPDLSPLKNLFNVTSTSVSHQTYILNGQMKHEIGWQFTLMPLKKGLLLIEPISVGNQKTNSVKVMVSEGGSSEVSTDDAKQTAEPIYHLETQIISPKNQKPFIQQQINYIVRFIDEGNLQIESVGFESTDDFIIKDLAKPKVKTLNNGKREIIFSYALFALKSGKLKLPKAHIQGYVYQKPKIENVFGNGFFSFQMPSFFGVQTPVTLTSDELTADILPAPADYQGQWWLPAKDVALSAYFVSPPQVIRVGAILKREINIKAIGLTGEQLPEIESPSTDAFKQYPEAPHTETDLSGTDIIGTLTAADVIIPQKAGIITLPEIKINWYDLNAGQIKTAVVPQQEIRVLPNANIKENIEESAAPSDLPQGRKSANKQTPPQQKETVPPYALFIAAFVGGMIFCYLILKPKKEKKQPQAEGLQEKDIFSKIKKDDLKTLRDRLILWAQTNYKNKQITNLNDLADILGDQDFKKAVGELSEALYGSITKSTFSIKSFQKIFKRALKNKKKAEKAKNSPIPPLYG